MVHLYHRGKTRDALLNVLLHDMNIMGSARQHSIIILSTPMLQFSAIESAGSDRITIELRAKGEQGGEGASRRGRGMGVAGIRREL